MLGRPADDMPEDLAGRLDGFGRPDASLLEAARTMMQAGAALLRAGGAGVFIDNSALAHGGQQWLEMTEDGSPMYPVGRGYAGERQREIAIELILLKIR